MQQSVANSVVWHSTRYRVERELARGGMGVVYEAFDRLARRRVAIKRVEREDEAESSSTHSTSVDPRLVAGSAPPHLSSPSSTGSSASLSSSSLEGMSESDHQRLALAREFRILASLRHPHIISVLDYGFDEQGRSYLVMELLDDARTLKEASGLYSLEQRVVLLAQLMQALRYLHRAGVVHRDLKPQNVLLVEVDGEPLVKVVDFGLAVWAQHHDPGSKPAGTVAYMAPEVVTGAPPSVNTDIYALGVLSYELVAGRHPHDNVASAAEMLTAARYGMANVSTLPLSAEGRKLIAAMLSPKPSARPRDAGDALARWCAATGLQTPSEPRAIRDSFLSAARFVGRERELVKLTHALDEAMAEQGSAWLVSGVSGVGKSRLLDEVKAAAQVRGMLVLRGQALDTGGHGLALWRDILREVALYVTLSSLEAAVLKELVSELDVLLERPIAPAPPLGRDGNLRRLAKVVEAAFDRLQVPVLVVLEDLQWAAPESAALLMRVVAGITGRRAVVLGSLRSDERPAWLDKLEVSGELSLEPFGAEHIGALCEAIIGRGTASPEAVSAIRQSSGGNAFLIVELLRSLAEDRGGLEEAVRDLYERRVPMSPEVLLERRLARVPDRARGPLELAAVAGRQIDQAMLAVVLEDVDGWLQQCAAVNVLELVEERWRFCHDKLRERLLAQLTPVRRQALHQRAADALQRAYGLRVSAADAAYHLQQAGQKAAALPYLLDAAEQALKQGALTQAQSFAKVALQYAQHLPGTLRDKARARLVLIDTCYGLGEETETVRHTHELLADAGLTPSYRPPTALTLVRELARAPRQSPIRLVESRHSLELWMLILQAVHICFRIEVVRSQGPGALYLMVLGHNLARSLRLADHAAAFRAGFAYALMLTPLRALGLRISDATVRVVAEHGGEDTALNVHESRGFAFINLGRLGQAASALRKLEESAASIGDERRQLIARLQRTLVAQLQGDLASAQRMLQTVQHDVAVHEDHLLRAMALERAGWLALHQEQVETARVTFAGVLAVEPPEVLQLSLYGGLSVALWMMGEGEEAEQAALKTLRLVPRRLAVHAGVFALPGLTHMLLARHAEAPSAWRWRHVKTALRCMRDYGSRFLVAEAQLCLVEGRAAQQQGSIRQARVLFGKAAVRAQQRGLVLDHAMAQIALGALPDAGREAQRCAREAKQELQRRGAPGCIRLIGSRLDDDAL